MKKNHQQFLFALAVAILAFILFKSILTNEFTGFDDLDLISKQWNSIQETSYFYGAFTDNVFQSPSGDYYRPLQLVTYKLDLLLWARDTPSTIPFLKGNILWLVVSLTSVFFTLSQWFLSPTKAFLATLIILFLPATVQSVCWIPGRGELILMSFTMLYLHFFLAYLKTNSFCYKFALLTSFLVCLFTKETAVVIPFISFLYYLCHKNNINIERSKMNILWAYMFAMTLLWLVCRSNALGFVVKIDLVNELSKLPFRTILTIGQLILPYPLAVFKGWDVYQFLRSIMALTTLIGLIYSKVSTKPLLYWGFVWVILFSLPSGLNSLIMYHRGYVTSIGLVFIFSSLKPFKQVALKMGIAGVLFLVLFLAHNKFKNTFKTPRVFWQNAYMYNSKSGMAINGLAWTYQKNNETDKAIALFKKSISLNPKFPGNRINLAYAYAKQNKFDSLSVLLMDEFKNTKDSAITAYHYGGLLLQKGDTATALPYLKMGFLATAYNYRAKQYYDTLNIELN